MKRREANGLLILLWLVESVAAAQPPNSPEEDLHRNVSKDLEFDRPDKTLSAEKRVVNMPEGGREGAGPQHNLQEHARPLQQVEITTGDAVQWSRDYLKERRMDNFQDGPRDNIQEGSRNDLHEYSRDDHHQGSIGDLQEGLMDGIQKGSGDDLQEESNNDLQKESKDNIQERSSGDLQEGSRDDLLEGSNSNLQEESRDNIQERSSGDQQEGSRETTGLPEDQTESKSPPDTWLQRIFNFFWDSLREEFQLSHGTVCLCAQAINSRAGHSLFISRFALRSPLFSFPWIAIALALI